MIAVNSKHSGDRGKDHRGYAEPYSGEQLDALLAADWLREMVAQIRGGDERLKDQLPFLCPHYGAFRNNHRAQADIIPESFTFMTCVDVDDPGMVDEAIKQALQVNGEAGDWHDQVLRIAYSARKKVHIYIRLPVGMTIAEAQQSFCAEIGVPYDAACITPERFIYLTGRDEEVFRSVHWLEEMPEEELAERREAYLLRGLGEDGRSLKGLSPNPSPVGEGGTNMTAGTGGAAHANDVRSLSPKPSPVGEGGTNMTVGTGGAAHANDGRSLSPKPSPVGEGGTNMTAGAGGEASAASLAAFDLCVEQAGLKGDEMDVWGQHNWHNNLMAVLSVGVGKLMSREQLMAVVSERLPNYSQTEDCRTLINYFYQKYDADKGYMNTALRQINAKAQQKTDEADVLTEDGDTEETPAQATLKMNRLPMGVKDSVEAVGQHLMMPVVTAVCPCIGALATGVRLDVHGQKRGLNLIAYIAGDFASGKGQIDPVVTAWMAEQQALDAMYLAQEEEWCARKRAAKNKKEQPDEPKLPVRCVALNSTVAKLADRLANTEGKHAYSFTPEADTVAQKWRSAMSDFSVMLRQSYDGSRYDREARSVDAVTVHINQLLWNVTMCGTPDALFRVVTNYTDGLQSRIALARTPDNTFTPLADKPRVMTEQQAERIHKIAHLLPLMAGEVVLPKLEARGRDWLERIRIETMMNDDRVKARQRFRVCVTAQRMTCCLMLCKVCETLIQKHGLSGAETLLKQNTQLWREMLVKAQTKAMLDNFDVIADSLMENALHFFRDRIEQAFNSRDYVGAETTIRHRKGRNDSIYERLDQQFTFEQAMQQTVAMKGAGATSNTVEQMLKNWRRQGLIFKIQKRVFKKKMPDV